MSLTGDPLTDRMVPVAMRLVGAVREFDKEQMLEAMADADAVAGDRALSVLITVLAAMVPYDGKPSRLLAWCRRKADFDRLTAAGIEPAVAASVIHQFTEEGGYA